MGLSKHRIGEFAKPISIKCGVSKHKEIKGINIDKKFMPSRNVGEDTSKYLIVPPSCFACNLMHVGRDEKIPVAMNDFNHNLVVSPAYFVFSIDDEEVILRRFFYIIMSSPEFDRFACFCTDSSIRGNLEWERFCEIELELPDIPTQQKYVDIYEGLQRNIEAYENGIDDLHRICRLFIESIKGKAEDSPIGKVIAIVDERNIEGNDYEFIGINKEKQFMPTVANTSALDSKKYKVIRSNRFVYSGMQTGRDKCIRIGLYTEAEPALISPAYITFEINSKKVLPSYLFIHFLNPEMDRLGWFYSDGSIRSNLDWDRFCEITIPLPDIEIQKDIVAIYGGLKKRKKILADLYNLQKTICPILIKGAIEEAEKEH